MNYLNSTPFISYLRYAKGEMLNCTLGNYANGQIALLLTDAETGEPVAKATVALLPAERIRLPEGSVALKDWSENEGLVETLRSAGLIHGECLMELPLGFYGASAKVFTLRRPA